MFANVVCKWLYRGNVLEYASYVFRSDVSGGACFDACVVPLWWEECVVQVLLGATMGSVPVKGRLV